MNENFKKILLSEDIEFREYKLSDYNIQNETEDFLNSLDEKFHTYLNLCKLINIIHKRR